MAQDRPPRRNSWLIGTMLLVAVGAPACGGPERQSIPGLHQRVEIRRDRWGIAHIRAEDEHDLFFAQGYNVARDRLFQLEVWRRQATGTLAEILGARAMTRDVGSRQLRYRGDLAKELARYHPRGGSIISAFVEGINAYIASLEADPARLPLEFRMLGIKPGRWTPDVVISRHNGLYRNLTSEVQYARLVHAIGPERARGLLNLHPGRPSLEPDQGLDLGLIGQATIEGYEACRAAVKFLPEDVLPEYRSQEPRRKAAAIDPADRDEDSFSLQGSNNWVVSGDRTLSGSAIMANDPHRAITVPSLRYWVHLTAPGWDVIGAGEPALPGVAAGHNARGAWGFTIFAIDQEDLLVYETDPSDPSRYRDRGAWQTMRVERETVPVKGQDPTTIELKFTRQGPVIHEDKEHHRAYGIKAAWLEEGTAPYLASLRIAQAGNWAEFREGCRHFLTPSENIIWADVDGHIGWQAVGLAPNRRGWDGLLPVPGDGRREWDGYHPGLELPHVVDPPGGFFATANQDNMPKGFPFAVSLQWAEPYRFARIEEVLGSGRRLSLTDMTRLQHDELALPARSMVPMLRGLKPSGERAKKAVAMLTAWDFVLEKESVPAAIYVGWERALKRSIWERSVPREAREIFNVSSLSTEKVIGWLTSPDGRFGPDPLAGRDALLLSALDRALTDLERRLGADPNRWTYGQAAFKHVRLVHPLSEAVRPELRARLDIGPLPRGGYGHTVNSTSDADNQATGASFRIIADTGDWDRSLGTSTPGQSGDPESSHYNDLFGTWADGRYFPVFFSPSKIESVTEQVTLLEPMPPSAR